MVRLPFHPSCTPSTVISAAVQATRPSEAENSTAAVQQPALTEKLAMRDYPILFGEPMVRATLEGCKMQTSCASLIAIIDAPEP